MWLLMTTVSEIDADGSAGGKPPGGRTHPSTHTPTYTD
jgi:hypothetical protein